MSSSDEQAQENGAPSGHDSGPATPGARIGEGPDLNTLLTEALEEARALTGVEAHKSE